MQIKPGLSRGSDCAPLPADTERRYINRPREMFRPRASSFVPLNGKLFFKDNFNAGVAKNSHFGRGGGTKKRPDDAKKKNPTEGWFSHHGIH